MSDDYVTGSNSQDAVLAAAGEDVRAAPQPLSAAELAMLRAAVDGPGVEVVTRKESAVLESLLRRRFLQSAPRYSPARGSYDATDAGRDALRAVETEASTIAVLRLLSSGGRPSLEQREVTLSLERDGLIKYAHATTSAPGIWVVTDMGIVAMHLAGATSADATAGTMADVVPQGPQGLPSGDDGRLVESDSPNAAPPYGGNYWPDKISEIDSIILEVERLDGQGFAEDFMLHRMIGAVPEGYGLVGGADGYFRKLPEEGQPYQGGYANPVPRYTSSVDAALTLRPKGASAIRTVEADENGANVFIGVDAHHGRAFHASEPIATCIAALKVRRAMLSAGATP